MTGQQKRLEQRSKEDPSAAAVISDEIVQIFARYYGRGPTRTKTIIRDDLVLCVLADVFTRAEHVLTAANSFEQVRRTRQAFQDTVAPLMVQTVESATGRAVQSFLSQISPEGYASEVFVLEA